MSQRQVLNFINWRHDNGGMTEEHFAVWFAENYPAQSACEAPMTEPAAFQCPHKNCTFSLTANDLEANASRIVFHYSDALQHIPLIVFDADIDTSVFDDRLVNKLRKFVLCGSLRVRLTKGMRSRILRELALYFDDWQDKPVQTRKRKRIFNPTDTMVKVFKDLNGSPHPFESFVPGPVRPLFPDALFCSI